MERTTDGNGNGCRRDVDDLRLEWRVMHLAAIAADVIAVVNDVALEDDEQHQQ